LSRFVGSTSNSNLGRIKFADLLSRDRVAGNAASDRRQLIEGMNHSSLQQPVDQQHDCKIEAKCPSSTLDIAALFKDLIRRDIDGLSNNIIELPSKAILRPKASDLTLRAAAGMLCTANNSP